VELLLAAGSKTCSGSGVSSVERSTIHLASWCGSRGRFPFPTVMIWPVERFYRSRGICGHAISNMLRRSCFSFAPNVPGSSALLAHPLANLSMKRSGTLSCSATGSSVHVCAKHPRAKSQSAKRDVKQDWEKLYRAAIIESDRGKLLQRVEDAEAAILERSRCLSKSSANSGKRAGSYHSGTVHFELAAGKSRRLTRLLRERERLPPS